MIRVKRKALREKFFIFMFFLCLLLLPPFRFTLPPVHAQETSPSAEIKIKLDALKKEIASKAAKLKEEINQKLQNKAYIGSIKTLSENTITIATPTGSKVININQDTLYETNVKKTTYSFKKATEEDYIAALGDIDDTKSLTARKIILLTKPQDDTKTILWGQITTLSDDLIIKTKEGISTNVLLDTDTRYHKGEVESNFNSLKINDSIIVVGTVDKASNLNASFVYIMPQGIVIKPKKVSTPSAQIATKSAQTASKSAEKVATPSTKKR